MISVCMAVYNGESFLKQQLDSILCQLADKDEIIVVDDESSDKSIEIINRFGDPRIKVISNSANIGVVRSFEKAIAAAKGDFIFLADQDDVWMEGKVTTMLDVFVRDRPLAIVSNAIIVGADAGARKTFFEWRNSGPGVFKNLLKNRFLGCCMAFDKRAKEFLLPFPKFTPMHDEWIGLACSIAGTVAFVEKPLIYYRRHDNNVTYMHRGSLAHFASKRIKLIGMIASRFAKLWRARKRMRK